MVDAEEEVEVALLFLVHRCIWKHLSPASCGFELYKCNMSAPREKVGCVRV